MVVGCISVKVIVVFFSNLIASDSKVLSSLVFMVKFETLFLHFATFPSAPLPPLSLSQFGTGDLTVIPLGI